MSDGCDLLLAPVPIHYEVESKRQTLGVSCTCGFESHVKRDHTKHIVTETLIAAGRAVTRSPPMPEPTTHHRLSITVEYGEPLIVFTCDAPGDADCRRRPPDHATRES